MQHVDVGEVYDASTGALEAAKGPRLSLRRAVNALYDVVAAPIPARPDEWVDRLVPVLEHLCEVWEVHIRVTEAPGALYEEILENAPRLANRIARFKDEHAVLTTALGGTMGQARDLDPSDPAAAERLRVRLVRLFGDLVRHSKRGMDLVYEAYDVDIGGES
jgi:hypothetical protein